MKTKSRKEKKLIKESEGLSRFYLLPLALVLVVVPLIVQLKVVPLEGAVRDYWVDSTNYDFFSYYKARWIIWCTIVATGVYVYLLTQGKVVVKKTKIYIPMGVYSLLTILSAIFSKYRNIALWGFPDRYEGMFVLLSYMILLFITINMVSSEKHIRFLIGCILTSATILGLIGLFQFIGYDLFNAEFGKQLILPSRYSHFSPHLKFEFKDNTIYSTLLNPNYVGVYMAMISMLSFILAILYKGSMKTKLYLVGVTILSFINLYGSGSRTGIIIVIILLGVVAFVIRKKLWFNKKIVTLMLTLFTIAILGIVVLEGGSMLDRIRTGFRTPSQNLRDITVVGNEINIEMNENSLTLRNENQRLNFYNKDNELLPTRFENNQIYFEDQIYKDIYTIKTQTINGQLILQFLPKTSYGRPAIYTLVGGDNFFLMDQQMEPVTLRKIPSWGFKEQEKLFSNRGFIWSRSAPLLSKTVILGFGPDTYAMNFPQDDYVGKLIAFGNVNNIVDKPHNLYLQTGLSTGILSLLALMVVFLIAIISGYKSLAHNYDDTYGMVGIAILFSCCVYLMTALLNDSVVSVAPVFWVLLGILVSISISRKVLRTNNEVL